MNYSLSNVITDFYKGRHLLVFRMAFFAYLKTWFTELVKVKTNKCFWILLSLHKSLNKEPRINYVPEIRNGYDLLEQAFRRYCIDPLVFNRWGYT